MKKRILIVGIVFSMVALPLQGCSKESDEVSSNVEEMTQESTTEPTTEEQIVQSNDRAIYVTKTGQKYHYNDNCNGATYIEITLEELNTDYSTLEPCSKCAM